MEIKCVVNRQSIKKNKALKSAQKSARKYYQEKKFMKSSKEAKSAKAKIRKLADLRRVDYKVFSDIEQMEKKQEAQLSKDELIAFCRKTELTGRSGNGFEVSRKLEAIMRTKATLIINGVECDPGLVTDSWLYRNRQKLIEQGARILRNALELDKVILATKEPLRAFNEIQEVKVADRFPMGYEKYLIQNVLGVRLEANELPQEKGIIVMNLQTVIAIAEMTQNIMAAQYKYITVANLYTAEAKVVRVRIGDSVKAVAESCFFKRDSKSNSKCNSKCDSKCDSKRIYAGGGAFSCHEAAPGEKILDTTGYIAIGDMPKYQEAAKCKGCKACSRNCPAGVSVHKIVQHVEKKGMKRAEMCKSFNPTACIGCGACTYGCMAGKDVREVIRWAKKELS